MARLLDLPDELVLEILGYIDCFDQPLRTTSLRGINLVNKRLYSLSCSYLYSTFSFFAGVPYLFLRTICQNQDLARHVKVINWDYDTSAAESLSYTPGVLAIKQQFRLDGVREKLNELSTLGNDVAKWMQEQMQIGRLYLGDLRALYALLLFATNTEELIIAETWRWDDHLYWFMPINHSHTNALSRLTSASLNGPMRLQNVTSLLINPTMRRLELTGVIEMNQELDRTFDWEEKPWEGLFDKSRSNIEHFHLYHSYVNLNDVKVAVRYMKDLKSFLYQHEANELSNAFIPLKLDALSEVMKSQSHSLVSLHIEQQDFERHVDFSEDFQDPAIIYKTAQSLTKLVNFEMSHITPTTTGIHTPEWQHIPANLECLALELGSLRCYDEDYDFMDLQQSLEALAARKRRGELPSLRALTLKRWHPWYGCVPRNVEYIKNVLQDAGVQFSSEPAKIGSSHSTGVDISWVELQTEPDWVFVETYLFDVE